MPLAEKQSDSFRVWNIDVIMIRSRPEITQLFIFFTHNTRRIGKTHVDLLSTHRWCRQIWRVGYVNNVS